MGMTVALVGPVKSSNNAGFRRDGIDGLNRRPLQARLRESCFFRLPLSRSESLRDKPCFSPVVSVSSVVNLSLPVPVRGALKSL